VSDLRVAPQLARLTTPEAAGSAPSARSGAPGKSGTGQEVDGGFAAFFRDALSRANRLQNEAQEAAAGMARGETGTLETMLTLSRARSSLDMVLTVRNRALEAYQSIMRLQV